jgi:hypothetical protein
MNKKQLLEAKLRKMVREILYESAWRKLDTVQMKSMKDIIQKFGFKFIPYRLWQQQRSPFPGKRISGGNVRVSDPIKKSTDRKFTIYWGTSQNLGSIFIEGDEPGELEKVFSALKKSGFEWIRLGSGRISF